MTPRSIARARFDYAVRASLSLVRAPDDALVKSARIADESGVPPPFLARILAALVDAGLIHSVRGANGGYRLAGPADSISLGAILRAVDAPAFQDGDRGPTDGALWSILDREFDRVLERITLAEIAAAEVPARA
jgi:Rrf2 family protein